MNLLIIGDIVGKGGRKAVKELVPILKREHNCSFCIANGENSASGSGMSVKCVKDISTVVDVITTGDHIWDQKNFDKDITQFKNIIRPANLSNMQPGKGFDIFRNPAAGEIAVINLQGKVFMRDSAYCPFETVENILEKLPKTVNTIIVDLHAEATSEKIAMGRFLDGKVTAVVGTHTHVQTADEQILDGGTAYITDIGMVGGVDSVLGREIDAVLKKFRTGIPCRLPVVENRIRLNGVVVSYDVSTGRATNIKRISRIASC